MSDTIPPVKPTLTPPAPAGSNRRTANGKKNPKSNKPSQTMTPHGKDLHKRCHDACFSMAQLFTALTHNHVPETVKPSTKPTKSRREFPFVVYFSLATKDANGEMTESKIQACAMRHGKSVVMTNFDNQVILYLKKKDDKSQVAITYWVKDQNTEEGPFNFASDEDLAKIDIDPFEVAAGEKYYLKILDNDKKVIHTIQVIGPKAE